MTARCPGENICERITGVAGDTLEEKWQEASPGCPRQCRQMPLDKSDEAEIESEISGDESNYVCEHIENLVLDYRIGNLKVSDCEFWELELVKYWIKTVEEFDRTIQIKLGIIADGWLK